MTPQGYAPVPASADSVVVSASASSPCAPGAVAQLQETPWWRSRLVLNGVLVASLGGALLLTYDSCISCVLAIALLSFLTLNCIPFMPIIFILSAGVLLIHTVTMDMRQASLRVEIPLNQLIALPTYDQVQQGVDRYVHLDQPGGLHNRNTPAPPPPPQQQQLINLVPRLP